MKTTTQIITVVLLFISAFSLGQSKSKAYDKNTAPCMWLLAERSNVVIINDTNRIDFHFNGYSPGRLTLKGDSSVTVIQTPNHYGARIVPTKKSFELYLHDPKTDSLLFTQKFVALKKSELKSYRAPAFSKKTYCDYITSTDQTVVYKSVKNKIHLLHNNYDPDKITFEVSGATIVRNDADGLTIIPGNYRKCKVTAMHDGIQILSSEFLIL